MRYLILPLLIALSVGVTSFAAPRPPGERGKTVDKSEKADRDEGMADPRDRSQNLREGLERIGRAEADRVLRETGKRSRGGSHEKNVTTLPIPRPEIAKRAGKAMDAAAKSRSRTLLVSLNHMTDSYADAFRKMADTFASHDYYAMMTYRIAGVAPGRHGESKLDTLERVVKHALHRDFPITGDDGGYSFTRLDKKASFNETADALDQSGFVFDNDTGLNEDSVADTIMWAARHDMLVMVGRGSGNNTIAEIIVVADPKHMEFVALISSNFGSDN